MTNVSVTKSINVAADTAWTALSSFRGIENYSPIAKSTVEGNGPGAKRTCVMPDGAEIFEVLNQVNDSNKEMVYSITSGPFPVENYKSTIVVKSVGSDTCEITWSCSFDPAEGAEDAMKETFSGFYNIIIEGLEEHIKQPA